MKKILSLFLSLVILVGCSQSLPPAPSPTAPDPVSQDTARSSPEPTAAPTRRETAAPTPSSIPTTASPTPGKTRSVDPSPTAGRAQPGQEQPYQTIVQLVIADAATRLGIGPEQITVLSIESVNWSDAGLGCPVPGMMYAQVITPGYRILLEAEGQTYRYHTDRSRAFVLCQQGQEPQMPVIPVDKDEILDGDPWMPVNPLPTPIRGDDVVDPEPIK
jgi:hypothetical protein